MGIWAVRASSPGNPPGVGDRDVARVLGLLADDRAEAVTMTELRERGIEAPAQAIYTLQLTGYQIDRVPIHGPNGRRTTGYRMRSPLPRASGRSAHEVSDDAL